MDDISQRLVKSERLDQAYNNISEIINKSILITSQIKELALMIEELESRFCKDSLGRELGLPYYLKLKDIKTLLGSSLSSMSQLSRSKNRLSLAFDSMRNNIDSGKVAKK